MTDTQVVTVNHRTSIRPQRRAGSPSAGHLHGIGVLAAVCGGLFGGRARPDASVLAGLSPQALSASAVPYQAAA
jgi:hypothetical protein